MELRPLPDIQRENEALRKRAGRTRKMKSNAAVTTAGIITFGHTAQEVFNRLPQELQDRAFRELAQEIAAQLKTSLEALVVHLDETATHAHFTMRAYNDDGNTRSKTKRANMSGRKRRTASARTCSAWSKASPLRIPPWRVHRRCTPLMK